MARSKLNIVVKIGTLALSGADGAPDAALLGCLAGEIAALKKAGHNILLVTSGAIGSARALLRKNRPLRQCNEIAEKQILASIGQPHLITLYQKLLAPHGLIASQILLTRQDFHSHLHHYNIIRLLTALHRQPHILPIINENDSVTVEELKDLRFTDNDELAGLLASLVKADRLIILSHIKGVYDRPPDQKGAKIIPFIDFANGKNTPKSTKGKSAGGRGGMQSKLGTARRMAALGMGVHIASAREKKVLARILKGEKIGTAIVNRRRK